MYYLRSMACRGVFEALSTGIRVRTCDTNWGKLREIVYLLPPINEQKEIANYLDTKCAEINDIIKNKKEQLETLEKEKNDIKVISEKLEVINERLSMKQKQKRKRTINFLIIMDVCIILLFILLAVLGSPYQSWDYSDPEWSVIGTIWHSFEWVFFKVAPIVVMVITLILEIILIKRNK